MLKRVLGPVVLLYVVFGILVYFIVNTKKPTSKNSGINKVAPVFQEVASPSPLPTPTIIPSKAEIQFSLMAEKPSGRNVVLKVNAVALKKNLSIDALNLGLLMPQEQFEIISVKPGDLLSTCPQQNQSMSETTFVCTTPLDSEVLPQDEVQTFLTITLYLREPYTSGSLSLDLSKTTMYSAGREIPGFINNRDTVIQL